MKLFSNLLIWLDKNNTLAFALIRIFLGVALFVRGWIMISDPAAIIALAGEDKIYWWYSYITIMHLIGGFLLAIGFLTRFASLLQIPILFGAVFLIHLKQGLLSVGQSLELSVLVLMLLLLYFIFGSGVLSVDNYLKKKKSG
jgi:putative oxidoreductase